MSDSASGKDERTSANGSRFGNPPRAPGPPSGRPSPNASFSRRGWLTWVVVLAFLLPWLVFSLSRSSSSGENISYSSFRTQVENGNVTAVTVKGDELQGKLGKAQPREEGKGTYTDFVVQLPPQVGEDLISELETKNVDIRALPESTSSPLRMILDFLPILLLFGIGFLFLRGIQSRGQQIFSMGKSRATLYKKTQENVTFSDVAGIEGAKTELHEIIDFLDRPSRFAKIGGEHPRGVLLVGPPGTGKTLLARATAGEAGVAFFSITGSDFMEMFVGVGASRVRDLFSEARKAAPCIVFIDELDSIGRRRGTGIGGGHDEREQTLNQLLSEMDGFQRNEGVIVMAATNRPDILDPALLRPGRFDRQVTVGLPSLQARKKILEIHARNKPLADDVDLREVARGTPGFSGAELKNLLNEAALLAARQNKSAIEAADIEAARDKVLLGLEREGVALTEDECRHLSYHEGGHAVLAALLPNADPLHKVTIVPRGRAMGVTQQLPERDKYIYSRPYLEDRLTVMLGGRAAEDLVFETNTSGAEQDLKEATQLARKMVLDWGMSEHLGHLAFGGPREFVFLGEEMAERRDYSETTAREIDQEVRSILDEAYDRAHSLLAENREGLERVAQALLAHEELSGQEVVAILDGGSGSLDEKTSSSVGSDPGRCADHHNGGG